MSKSFRFIHSFGIEFVILKTELLENLDLKCSNYDIVEELLLKINQYRAAKRALGLDHPNLLLRINGQALYAQLVYRLVKEVLGTLSGVEKRSPHVLRHTFATHMLNNGAGLETLKDLLGHANLSATQVYTHNSFAQLRKAYGSAHPRALKTP